VLTIAGDGAVSMRVHERGVGETRSCGTGTVAAAVAALAHLNMTTGTLRVRIPGGEVTVEVSHTSSSLRGPSCLVAHGEVADVWWAAQR
jgi:diaminopimelate epimerase